MAEKVKYDRRFLGEKMREIARYIYNQDRKKFFRPLKDRRSCEKTFGLVVILKLANVEYTDNGKGIQFDLKTAEKQVKTALKRYNIKLKVRE